MYIQNKVQRLNSSLEATRSRLDCRYTLPKAILQQHNKSALIETNKWRNRLQGFITRKDFWKLNIAANKTRQQLIIGKQRKK